MRFFPWLICVFNINSIKFAIARKKYFFVFHFTQTHLVTNKILFSFRYQFMRTPQKTHAIHRDHPSSPRARHANWLGTQRHRFGMWICLLHGVNVGMGGKIATKSLHLHQNRHPDNGPSRSTRLFCFLSTKWRHLVCDKSYCRTKTAFIGFFAGFVRNHGLLRR